MNKKVKKLKNGRAKEIEGPLSKDELISRNTSFATNGTATLVLGNSMKSLTNDFIVVPEAHYFDIVSTLRTGSNSLTPKGVMETINKLPIDGQKGYGDLILYDFGGFELYDRGVLQ